MKKYKLYELSNKQISELHDKYFKPYDLSQSDSCEGCPLQIKGSLLCWLGLRNELASVIEKKSILEDIMIHHQRDEIEIE